MSLDWLRKLRGMAGRDARAAELEEEMRLHFDLEVEEGVRLGLSREEAVRRARERAGSVAEGAETGREALGFRWLDGAGRDARHAARALRRNRGFALVVLVVLAATVAVDTLVFFMLDGVVLRPLPYRSPERLVRVYDASPAQPKFPMSIGHYLDFRREATSLDGLALYTGSDLELGGGDGPPARLRGLAITSEYFSVLGATPALGRTFADDDLRSGVRDVVLSYGLWRDRFRSDPDVVGKSVRLDRVAWTVIGVAPEGFQHVGGDYRSPLQGETVDVWLPLPLDGPEGDVRYSHYCNAIARLRDGASAESAREELAGLEKRYRAQYPRAGEWEVRLEPLLDEVTGRSRRVVWLLVAAGALVLLVAGANVTGLTVARAVARRPELALRRSLGANRWQLVRVGLTENLLLGVAGAALGLAAAAAALPALRRLLPADFARAHEIAFDARGALFAVGLALATVLVASLLPSFGGDAIPSLGARTTGHRGARRLRAALVVAEIALAGLLCAGGLFLFRSFEQLSSRDHGFDPSGTLTFQLSVPRSPDAKPEDRARVYEAVRERIAEIPGVAAVGASTNLPWSGYDENGDFEVVGRPSPDGVDQRARYQAAGPGYFEATGMRVLRGRAFDRDRDASGQPLAIVINDAAARTFFGDDDPVGSLVHVFGKDRQVVGVVAGLEDAPTDRDVKPAFWLALGQSDFAPLYFAVRADRADPGSLLAPVTAAVRSVDPELPVADVRTLDGRVADALASQRFALWLFQAFAALALTLAAAGVYGLLSYVVRQRRKELAVRAALGARPGDLRRMVVADGLRMAGAGALVCVALIPVGGALLRGFLFDVGAFDPVTAGGAVAALVAIALVASLGPAAAATRCDPAEALRDDA